MRTIRYCPVMRPRRLALCLGLTVCTPEAAPGPAAQPAERVVPAPPAPARPTQDPTPTDPAASGRTSNLKTDEEARIFPAIGRREGDAWSLRVHGWVYEPEQDSVRRGAAVEALRAALGLPGEAADSDIFRARARAFLYDNESGKSLLVRIAGEEHELASTLANGHTDTDLRVTAAGVAPGTGGVLPIEVIPRRGDERKFAGVALLLPETGVSVVSDIDDTVKISEVRDKQKLLINTFMREFVPVPGMADAYTRWAGAGASFHYVSASPWQLYDALDGFFKGTGFPQGSLHLKQFRPKDMSFLALFTDPMSYKKPLITGLLTRFPARTFVLIGDSGEQDPEVYGAVYREHPDRIRSIHIRDVTGEAREDPRYAAAFAGVPGERWSLFTDAAALPSALP